MTDTEGEREYRIALAGSLPGEQANGWDDDKLKKDMDANRAKIRYALVAYNVLHLREVTESGKRVLTIAVKAVEPVTGSREAAETAERLQDLYTERTGQATLFAASETGPDATAGPYPGDPEWSGPA